MNLFKAVIVTLLCACSLIGIARFTHFQTRGFRISKITDNLCREKIWLVQDGDLDSHILQQRYRFLNRGLQSFAFVSEDNQYVIKIFNNRYQRRIKWFGKLSSFPLISEWAAQHHHNAHHKLVQTFSSYQIAHDLFQSESGLIYAHLDPTINLLPKLILIDPLGIEHLINLNQIGFIIQKKGELVYPTLLQYIQNDQMSDAKKAIAALIELFITKYKKGIADNDPLIRTNYGFINHLPFQIDVGPFTEDPLMANPENYHQEIYKVTRSLKHWLNEQSPELSTYLDILLAQEVEYEQAN